MRKTLQALITDVEAALYQSAGPGVQVYAEGIIERSLQEAFRHCYRAEWWPQYTKREVRSLLNGRPVAAFTDITQWDDIKYIFASGSDRPLMMLPQSLPSENMTGAIARYVEARDDDKLFIVHPLTSVGTVEVVGRKSYTDFAKTAIVPFDSTALTHYAAWSYYVDDGSNPASAAKHQGLFETRMRDLKNDAFSDIVELNSSAGYIPNRWH